MSIDSYRFVSPGVFFQEIDQSQVVAARPERGPVIIGRFPRGPGMRPIAVNSAAEFYNLYGNPHAGGGPAGDAWRGNPHGGPTYGAYAAEAHLNAAVSPATIFRVLGEANATPSSDNYAKAGWTTRNAAGAQVVPNAAVSSNGGAYGLFIMPSGSTKAMNVTGTLGAVFYLTEGSVQLQGMGEGSATAADGSLTGHSNQTASLGSLIASDSDAGVANAFNIRFLNSAGAVVDSAYIDFNRDTDSRHDTEWCRNALNTDPAACNSNIKGSAKTYWLGETFESMIKEKVTEQQSDAGKQYGVILPLHDGTNSYADHREDWSNPSTGWFFSNDSGVAASFDVYNMTKLFKFHAMDHAEWAQENIRISIENLRQYTSNTYKYGKFDVVVRSIGGRETPTGVLEIFTNCNLDRRSPNYIGRKIGDRYVSWDATNKVQRNYGSFNNNSSYIRVELAEALAEGSPEGLLPFGVYGPPRLRSFYVASGSTGFFSGSESRSTSGTVTSGFGHYADTASEGVAAVVTEGVAGRFATGDGSAMPATHPVDSTVSGVAASATDALDFGSAGGTNGTSDNDEVILTIPEGVGGSGAATTIVVVGGVGVPGANIVFVLRDSSDDETAKRVKAAINGSGDANYEAAEIAYGSGVTGGATGIQGVTATAGSGAHLLTLTADIPGVAGNAGTIADGSGAVDGDIAAVTTFTGGTAGEVWFGASAGWEGANFKIEYPAPKLVQTAKIDGTSTFHRLFGVEWAKWKTSGSSGTPLETAGGQLDTSVKETLRRLPASVASADPASSAAVEYSWVFTLDDVVYNSTGSEGFYVSGSRAAGTSYTALSGASNSDSDGLLQLGTDNKGFHGFSTFLYGGFDGLDICEAEPFRNTLLDDAEGDATKVAAYNSLIRSIETVADPEYVECNVMVAPGITDTYVTDKLVNVCEDRGDALAIIDLAGGYVPETENASAESARRGSVKSVVSTKNARNIDSSYGCAYYPWVQVKSATAAAGGEVYVPPSVVALGTMAFSTANSAIWFAPAGFTRGGLDSAGARPGAAGLKVLNVRDRLTSSDRDSLYEVNINPIAKFPAEGIVVFGQKTLQATASALDRINVRRLMLHVKKEISIIAATTLFQPNVSDTWTQFRTEANALLSAIQAQYGITEFSVVLDDTTTTDDLIDRNILYAQIYLKPARAIEFIAVDFIISSEGASFAD